MAKGNGIDYMNNGQYEKAIVELEKVSGKQDMEIQLALIKCYLLTGRENDANQIADAISKNKEYENASNKIAQVYLATPENCGANSMCCFTRLIQADRFATDPVTCKKIGAIEKAYATNFNGKQQKQLMQMAARHLGEENVFDFKIGRISSDTYKVTFFTNKPVKVLDLRKGDDILYVESSKEKLVFQINSIDVAQKYPLAINFPMKAEKDTSCYFAGEKGSYFIFKSQNISISDTE